MRIKGLITTIAITLILTSFTMDGNESASKNLSLQQLSEQIFEACSQTDSSKLIGLIATKQQMEQAINAYASIPLEEIFIKSVLTKLNPDSASTTHEVLKGMNDVNQKMTSCEFKGKLEVDSIYPDTHTLNRIPIDIGHLGISYRCKKEMVLLDVEVIQTLEGWKVLKGLKVKYFFKVD